MKHQVLLFAAAKRLIGQSAVVLDLPGSATVADLRAALRSRHPALTEILAHAKLAVNSEYAADGAPLPPGAEIALIPPVSGG